MSAAATAVPESALVGMRLLISQVRQLQRAHRAGITPRYGQLEDLFETTELVERQLVEPPAGEQTVIACDLVECGSPFTMQLKSGRKLCAKHAAEAAWLLGDLQ